MSEIAIKNKASAYWLCAAIVAALLASLAILSFVDGYRSEPERSQIDAQALDRTDL